MNKKISFFVITLLLAVSYLLSSWYVGCLIKDNIQVKIEQINRQINASQDDFHVAISYSDYRQNFLSSQLHLVVNLLTKNGQPISLIANDITIDHGPFPLAALAKGQFIPQIAWIDYAMDEQISPHLWKLAGNKPFLTGNASINFQGYFTLQLISAAVNNLSSTFTIGGDEYNFEKINFLSSKLYLSNNSDFSDLSLTFTLTDFAAITDADTIKVSDLKLSLSQLEDNTGFSYLTEINGLVYESEQLSKSEIVLQHILSTGNIYKNRQYDTQISVDQLNYIANTNDLPVVINNVLLTQKNLSSTENNDINGRVTAAIESLTYGSQNLGRFDMALSYQGITNEVTKPFSDNTEPAFFSLDKLIWYNEFGQMSASLKANASNHYLSIENMDINELDQVKLDIDIPFNVLTHFAAQLANPQTNMVTAEQHNDMNQSMQMLAILLTRSLPIFVYSRNEIEGIYSNLDYSKNNNYVELDSEKISKKQFLSLFE